MTPTQQLADVKLGGTLEAFVRERRAKGFSWATISLELHGEIGVRVTGESLRTWYPDPVAEVAS